MKYIMMPVININDLREALVLQYGEEFRYYELNQIMFGDEYINDVYKRYFYGNGPVKLNPSWPNLREREIENCIITFLADAFRDFHSILVDVSW